ncbi:MAG TPA: hypothetical protein VHL78_07490 [Actinomycetota bacterium]|nr:hypothetical protein [Actinomycetota bacterium]
MRAEFFDPEAPDLVLAAAEWDGRTVRIDAEDGGARERLDRVFRPSTVAVDDPASRPGGSSGQTVLEPGDLQWFLTAARVRGEREGLAVRFVTQAPGGWDPAGAYRPMGAWIARRETGEPVDTLGTPSQ